jgi:hypothetical protein
MREREREIAAIVSVKQRTFVEEDSRQRKSNKCRSPTLLHLSPASLSFATLCSTTACRLVNLFVKRTEAADSLCLNVDKLRYGT